jgi:hypothetical protein
MKALILTRKEKEDLMIKLANQGKPTKYIAQVAHISPTDMPLVLQLHKSIKEEKLNEQMADSLTFEPTLPALDLKKKVNLYNNHTCRIGTKKVEMEK